mmetsp:Transcript_6201/g.7853  ORF Transcript_6201/g.7853 Transcript_6201/m.7853 type:complete len:220 (-) Transcript_6201:155-814(-)
MSEYQEYEEEYDRNLARVRSFLSSNVRSLTTLRECERLLAQAKRCATAMDHIAEEGGDAFQISECKFRVQRDVEPLMNEVDRALKQKENGDIFDDTQRDMLFSGYRAPTLGGGVDDNGDDMEMLIRSSEDMLRESQALCISSEEVGSDTLFAMSRQREQLYNASDYLAGAKAHMQQAKVLLGSMSAKTLRNKRFLQGIIVILILANIVVFIAIVKKKLK